MSTTDYSMFDILPNEQLDTLLQTACIVWCSDLKNQFETVFGTLSSVCVRWRQIMDSPCFRAKTMAKLIQYGYYHQYYERPQLELKSFDGVSGASFHSLDGDYYLAGIPIVENDTEPYECRHFVEREPASTSHPPHGEGNVRKEHGLFETMTISFLQPPDLSPVDRKFFVMSQQWCRHNKCLYIGYYCATDIYDLAAPFICMRISPGAQRDRTRWPENNLPWPIRSDDVAAWILPPHPEDVEIFLKPGCYCFWVSHKTGNVTIVDNINRRLIVYDQNGYPMGVVLLPDDVSGSVRRVAEIAKRQEDDIQYIVQYQSDNRHHICRVAVDRSTRSVSADVDSCPQYDAKVMARYDDDDDAHRATHVSHLADVDDNGLVVVFMATRNRDNMHLMAIVRSSDLRRVGGIITLPFNKLFVTRVDLDTSRGHFNVSVRDGDVAPLYCVIVHPAKQ